MIHARAPHPYEPEHPARWMADEVQVKGCLSLGEAVSGIEAQFGKYYLEAGRDGGTTVQRGVLAIFRMMTQPDVIWVELSQAWQVQKSRGG